MGGLRARSVLLSHIITLTSLVLIVEALPLPRAPPDIVCTPASNWDVILFFLLNYGAHAVTTKNGPGENTYQSTIWAFAALLTPYTGLTKAFVLISDGEARHWSSSDIEKATSFGALVQIGRTKEWRPHKGDVIQSPSLEPFHRCGRAKLIHNGTSQIDALNLRYYNIHGRAPATLPSGYAYYSVNADGIVDSEHGSPSWETKLATSNSRLKALIAIVQLSFGVATLYRTRGQQIDLYGYSAFGLTVVPYAFMSLCNSFANLVIPDYPSLFLVRTSVSDEAEKRGARFEGFVGRVRECSSPEPGETWARVEFTDVEFNTETESTTLYQFSATEISTETESVDRSDQTHEDMHQLSGNGQNRSNVVTLKFADIQQHKRSGGQEEDLQGCLKTRDFGNTGNTVASNVNDIEILRPTVGDERHSATRNLDGQIPTISTIFIPAICTYQARQVSRGLYLFALLFFISMITPYIVILAMTGFKGGAQSTFSQRAWVMSWLVAGQVGSSALPLWVWLMDEYKLFLAVFFPVCGISAIGGMVTVGRMIKQFGSCTSVG